MTNPLEFTGTLRSIHNPNFSGMATIEWLNTETKEVIVTYTESGYGVRQLVQALGDGRSFTRSLRSDASWCRIGKALHRA